MRKNKSATRWLLIVFLYLCFQRQTAAQTDILNEDFENGAAGWSVKDSEPIGGEVYWALAHSDFGTVSAHSGERSAYCAGSNYGGTYENPTYQNSMNARLSHTVDLSGVSVAELRFWYVIPSISIVGSWLSGPADTFRVRIDDTIVFSQNLAQTNWTQKIVDLDAYVGGEHVLTFEFFSDDTFSDYEGAYIDDILIVGDDPNDQISEALLIGSMSQTISRQGVINSPTDVDMFAVEVRSGQRISFDIDYSSESFDSVIRLFDENGNEILANDDAFGPVEEDTFGGTLDSYLEYSFDSDGIFYLGVSGYGNESYDAFVGDGDVNGSMGSYTLVVSSGIAGTIRRPDDGTDYPVDIVQSGAFPMAIDPAVTTWIVIHGWNSSRKNDNIAELVSSLVQARPQDQVLTLDWSTAADTGILDPFSAEDSIVPVAQWAASALAQNGFQGTNLNLIGHSFGSYVADETAKRIPGGKVNSIVGLDPAEDVLGGYSSNQSAFFGLHSLFSWAFYSSDPEGIAALIGGNYGNEETPATAHEAFTVENTTHGNIVFLFASLVWGPLNAISELFSLDRLISGILGPWVVDQYNYDGTEGRQYEAVITASTDGKSAERIEYYIEPPQLHIAHFEEEILVFWSMYSSGFVLQSSTNIFEPNSWTDVSVEPTTDIQFKVISVPDTPENQFFRLRKDSPSE